MKIFMKNILLPLFLFATTTTHLAAFDFGKLMESEEFDAKKGPNFDKKEEKKPKRAKSSLAGIPYPKLKKSKDDYVAKGLKAEAAKYLERMIPLCDDHEESCNLLMELADIYFDVQDYTKAEKTYQEFVLLYPGNKKVEYAHFRVIDCGFKLTLDPERDQTKTEEILTACQEFLKKSEFTHYKTDISAIAAQCTQKLLDHEINIFSFYLGRSSFKSAHARLETICKEFTLQLPACEPQFLELQYRLALAENKTQDILKTQWQLAQRFPEHEVTKKLVTDLPTLTLQIAQLEAPKVEIVPEQTLTVAQSETPKKFSNRF
jgi:outer membrane assembly lipoprotein YfiO